ncbi:MAG: ADOP family duplicated permease [Gemmatimonadales bacterium]
MAGRFRWPWRSRPQIAAEVDEELDFHLELRAAELVREGLSPPAARAAAEREFGDLDATRRYCRSRDHEAERARRWRDRLLDLRGDAVVAWRGWQRAPGPILVAIGTLAVAIGAAAAVFSVVDGVLFKTLPYRDAERVVAVYQEETRKGILERPSPGNFLDWRERLTQVDLAAAQPYGMTLANDGQLTNLSAFLVTDGYFRALGVDLALGRDFRSDEFTAGRNRVAIVSRAVWLDRFGGDPGAVGRFIDLDGDRHEIVGVLPPDIDYPDRRDLYVPKVFDPEDREARAQTYYRVVGRLARGASLATARSEFEQVTRALALEYPRPNANVVGRLVSVADDIAGKVRGGLVLMLVAVGLVMLVACVNVAGVLMTRAVYRRGEFAVRLALGAGRTQLVRLAVVEGLGIAAIASLLGWLVALGGTALAVRMAPDDLPRVAAIALDARAAGFLIGLGFLTALACAVLPARAATTTADTEVFRSRVGGHRAAGKTGRALAVFEVALAVVLLVAAGLLGKSFLKLTDQALGYRTDDRVLATVHVWDRYQTPERLARYADQVVVELSAIPGVRQVATANAVPLSAVGSEMDPPFLIDGEAAPAPGQEPTGRLSIVSPGYFAALGIPLVAGRLLDAGDRLDTRAVAVVGQTLARRYWPGGDPIGRAILLRRRDSSLARIEVVGVVGDTRFTGHDDRPVPEYYLPLAQRYFGSVTFVVHADPGASVSAGLVQAAFARVDPAVVVSTFESFDQLRSGTLATRRFILGATAAFAGIAMLLAAVGLYGVLSFLVSQRLPEIGIRLALGAERADVLRLIAGQGVALAAAGAAFGVLGALAARRWLAAQVWGIAPNDPTTLVAMATVALAVAFVASAIPAWRAGRVDPATSLRRD